MGHFDLLEELQQNEEVIALLKDDYFCYTLLLLLNYSSWRKVIDPRLSDSDKVIETILHSEEDRVWKAKMTNIGQLITQLRTKHHEIMADYTWSVSDQGDIEYYEKLVFRVLGNMGWKKLPFPVTMVLPSLGYASTLLAEQARGRSNRNKE